MILNNNATIPEQVEEYYWQHLNELDDYTRFHFLTRMYLLKGSPNAKQHLDQVFATHLAHHTSTEQWDYLNSQLVNPKQIPDEKRVALLQKYPALREYARYYFIVLFAQKIWQLDLSDILEKKVDQKLVTTLVSSVMNNSDELLSLSTFALNFIILSQHFFDRHNYKETIINLYSTWDDAWKNRLTSSESNDLSYDRLVYFVTHLLINDSLFYTRTVPDEMKAVHKERLLVIEEWLVDNITELSVDCLCEVIVAFEMVGPSSRLKDKIYQYVSQYLSSSGFYLTEPTIDKTIIQAEHTNVLFILGYKHF